MPAKNLKLRRDDDCVTCAAHLPAGVVAWWDRDARTVTCASCAQTPASRDGAVVSKSDRGRPGASLAREHQRRRSAREQRVREAHPRVGSLILALQNAPAHEAAFRLGEQGELDVGAAIEQAAANVGGIVLHNRRMPGGHGDIDHIAIVPSGVYVIDAKAVTGSVAIR